MIFPCSPFSAKSFNPSEKNNQEFKGGDFFCVLCKKNTTRLLIIF
jgi:hypothetical protein